MLSDFCIDLIVHWLKLSLISYSWDEKLWFFIDITTPRLIDQFISNDVLIITELSCNFSPKCGKFISQTIVVIIEISDSRADGMSEVVIRPRM